MKNKKYSWEFITLIAIVSTLIISILGVIVYLVSQSTSSTSSTSSEPNEQNGSGDEKSLLEFCSATDRPDKLAEVSEGVFSCCRHNQVCDLKWWDEYAPTIDSDNLGYITGLLGVDATDFGANSDTRYAAHERIVNDICPETCKAFRTKTYFKSLSESNYDDIEKITKLVDITIQGGFEPERDLHTGECILTCNSSADCNNVMYVNENTNSTNERGFCFYFDDSTAESIIDAVGMEEMAPDQSPLSSEPYVVHITMFRR